MTFNPNAETGTSVAAQGRKFFTVVERSVFVICKVISQSVKPETLSLTFDFIIHSPNDTSRMLDCLESLTPLEDLSFHVNG